MEGIPQNYAGAVVVTSHGVKLTTKQEAVLQDTFYVSESPD